MCLEDVRLGRELNPDSGTTTTNLSGVSSLFPVDPKRTRIIFLGDGTTGISVYPRGFNGGQFRGVKLTAQTPVQVVRVEDYGPLVWRDWLADDGGLGGTLSWFLMTLEKD